MTALKNILPLALRIVFGALLFYAGITKINAAWEFAENIASFKLLPAQANQMLALALPWAEVIAGVLLFFNLWVRPAGLVAVVLFGAFFVAVASALIRGLDIECGCFGPHSAQVGWKTLAIDIVGLVVSVIIIRTAHLPEYPPEALNNPCKVNP
jgi:uncharacterized membrane protein YphA (DoxX/SURF4 family)